MSRNVFVETMRRLTEGTAKISSEMVAASGGRLRYSPSYAAKSEAITKSSFMAGALAGADTVAKLIVEFDYDLDKAMTRFLELYRSAQEEVKQASQMSELITRQGPTRDS